MARRRTAEKKRAAVRPFAAADALMPMRTMTGVAVIACIADLRSRP